MKMAPDLKPTTSITLESICILLLKATFTASEALVGSKSPEVKVDLGIELSDLNYPGIHVHIACEGHFGGL